MRPRRILLALVVVEVSLWSAAVEVGAVEAKPIRARVAVPGAAVRSGPWQGIADPRCVALTLMVVMAMLYWTFA